MSALDKAVRDLALQFNLSNEDANTALVLLVARKAEELRAEGNVEDAKGLVQWVLQEDALKQASRKALSNALSN